MQLLSFLFLFSTTLFAAPQVPIHIGIGETHKIPSQPLETLRVQKKGLLQIKDEGSQILLIGKKLGKTSVQLGRKKYDFVVLHKYSKETLRQLQEWLKGKRGPDLEVINNQPRVQGRLLRLSDLAELEQFTDEKSTFQLQVQLEPGLLPEVNAFFKERLAENNLTPGRLSITPHWQYEIPPFEKKNLSLYKRILKPFGVEVRTDPHSLSQTPLIEVQVYIAHVKKSFMRNWGVQWPSQIEAQVIPGATLTWQALNVSLQALEETGQGHLLATPRLVTESNKEAEFHSGGEIPIRTTTQFNNNVQWKRYGLFLKTKVRTNVQRNLQVEIDLEMSSLDQESGSTDIPALTRSQVKTQVNLNKPQPIFLSGFLQSQSGQSRSGLPWLSQVPLFKPLFSSGQIYNRDYELVFILFPRIQNDEPTI